MSTYTARYAHSDASTAGLLIFDAANDAAAICEIQRFVAAGYRDPYTCRNVHGQAIGRHSR